MDSKPQESNWRRYAIIVAGAVILALLGWQLYTLAPSQWCNYAIDQSKLTGESVVLSLQACLSLQNTILGIKDHALIGLIALLGLMQAFFMVKEFNVNAKASGPNGFGFELDSDKVPFEGKVEGVIDSQEIK